jgi:Rha family phage regulatory protein
LILFGDGAAVDDRDVAERYEKRHDHVLRDIGGILGSSNLRNLIDQGFSKTWFRERLDWNEAANREIRSFDLTEEGFTMLVNGWSGPKAMRRSKSGCATTARPNLPICAFMPVPALTKPCWAKPLIYKVAQIWATKDSVNITKDVTMVLFVLLGHVAAVDERHPVIVPHMEFGAQCRQSALIS